MKQAQPIPGLAGAGCNVMGCYDPVVNWAAGMAEPQAI